MLQELESVVTRARHFQFKPDGDVTFMKAQDAVGLPAPLMQVPLMFHTAFYKLLAMLLAMLLCLCNSLLKKERLADCTCSTSVGGSLSSSVLSLWNGSLLLYLTE